LIGLRRGFQASCLPLGRLAPGLAAGPSRLPLPKASPTAPSVPPPFTAPARLMRVGRERKTTQKMRDAPYGRLTARTAGLEATAKLNTKILYTEIGACELKWLCL